MNKIERLVDELKYFIPEHLYDELEYCLYYYPDGHKHMSKVVKRILYLDSRIREKGLDRFSPESGELQAHVWMLTTWIQSQRIDIDFLDNGFLGDDLYPPEYDDPHFDEGGSL